MEQVSVVARQVNKGFSGSLVEDTDWDLGSSLTETHLPIACHHEDLWENSRHLGGGSVCLLLMKRLTVAGIKNR